jgi:hypothetical protein
LQNNVQTLTGSATTTLNYTGATPLATTGGAVSRPTQSTFKGLAKGLWLVGGQVSATDASAANTTYYELSTSRTSLALTITPVRVDQDTFISQLSVIPMNINDVFELDLKSTVATNPTVVGPNNNYMHGLFAVSGKKSKPAFFFI